MKIEIYTDGACNQKLKTGGWGFIIVENGIIKTKKGGHEKNTTNNQCEMLAAIKALEEISLNKNEEVVVYSDSAYLVNAFVENWISKWVENDWKTSLKEPVKNKELWERLIVLQKKNQVSFSQIKRRSNEFTKKVDDLANSYKEKN